MLVVSHKLAVAVFTPMMLLSVVGLTVFDYLPASSVGQMSIFFV
jgi:hypothetical protein